MKRGRRSERGVEAAAILFVMPVLIILVFALIDIAVMFTVRSQVNAVARDAVRAAAADGGNLNPRTNTTGLSWSQAAYRQLYSSGKCTFGRCDDGERPTVSCTKITTPAGAVYRGNVARDAGDLITCTVNYPYKGINQGLLDSPIGLGFGAFLKDFTVSSSSRSETGVTG